MASERREHPEIDGEEVVAGELVAEAVEQGLPVEEGVGAPYRRPLRRRPPAQDPDQRSLVRSPSCPMEERSPRQRCNAATEGN
jgi:hypothetical protein